MEHFPAKQIRPRVWIGSERDATSDEFWREHDIQFVVNCTRDVPFRPGVKGYRIPVNDHPTCADALYEHLSIAVRAIREAVDNECNVLVHCFAGMNRSATVTAAYLMQPGVLTDAGVSAAQAVKYIKDRKPECFTPMNFEKTLAMWELNKYPRVTRFLRPLVDAHPDYRTNFELGLGAFSKLGTRDSLSEFAHFALSHIKDTPIEAPFLHLCRVNDVTPKPFGPL